MKHSNVYQRVMVCLGLLMTGLPALLPAQNLIRQTILSSGVRYDYLTSSDTGSLYAWIPKGPGDTYEKASFELFAKGSAWDNNVYFLDKKVLGFYLPKATVRVVSQDPAIPVRTRADKPYQLQITTSGMTTDADAPLSAQKVLFTHTGINFTGKYVQGDNVEYLMNSFYTGNVSPSYTPVYTRLVPMAPTKAMGIERFTVSSLSDSGTSTTSILASQQLIVWPVTEATVTGVIEGETIKDFLPNLRIELKDLYPKSTTYVQMYRGAPALGTLGDVILSTLRVHDTVVPQNEIITLTNWDNFLVDDGVYTLEVITETPFDGGAPERLAYVSFNVKRNIMVRGQATTLGQ